MARTSRVLVDGLSFPEGPRWHQGALWFSDIHAHRVYRLETDGTQTEVAHIDDRTSGIGFLPNGDLLVVSMLDRRLIAVDATGKARVPVWYRGGKVREASARARIRPLDT